MPHPIYDMNSDYYIEPYTDDDGHETLESSSIRAEAMDRYDYDVRTEDISQSPVSNATCNGPDQQQKL